MAGKPSLEDLLKDVPPEKLDEPCRDDHLSEIALSVTEWQSIAPFLGLSEAEEEDIERDCAKNKTQKIKMLRKWKEKFGKRATYRRLARIFWKLDRIDLVGELCDILQLEGEGDGPPEAKKVGRDALELYADYLKGRYQTDIPSFFTLQWPPPPTRKVFNLAMVHEEPLRRGPLNEELMRLMLRGEVNDVMQRRTPIELEDLFKPAIHGKKRQVVLIEGAPGAGKSTLAWHICQKWENGGLFQEFEVTIFVQLRDPAIQDAKCIADILPAMSSNMRVEIEYIMKAHGGRRVLFVLDGWDEYGPGLRTDSVFRKLICVPSDLNMHLSTLVITSRPIASGAVQPYVSSRVEIVGFTPTELEMYFKEALHRDPHMVENLQQQLSIRPVIQASCYLPLNAAIVAHLFIDLEETLPSTLHEVFTTLVLCCIIRHLKRLAQEDDEIPDISSLDDLPSDIQEAFDLICSLAFRGVKENKATFSEDDFILPLSELSTLSLIQGIQCFRSLKQLRSYNFVHLSIQELLAAFHISKLPDNEQVMLFKDLFDNPRFETVFKFYAAFTKLRAEGILEVVVSFVQRDDLNVFHCLHEVQDPSVCQFVASQVQNKLLRLGRSPLDCLVVGYFLSCVCLTVSVQFTVDITSADDYSVSFLTRELSRCTCDPASPTDKVCGCLRVVASNSVHAAELINCCPAIKKLTLQGSHDLRQNIIGDSGIAYISKSLNVIKELHVSKCGITEKGTQCLADALTATDNLEVLDLRQNTIGDNGIASISESLKANCTLKKLCVSECEITEKGAQYLADALATNGGLEVLDLRQNTIGDRGIACICNVLKAHFILKALYVSQCGITKKGAEYLGDILRQNACKSFESLDLGWNQIQGTGIYCLFRSLRENDTLRRLSICGAFVWDLGFLASVLEVNKSLEVLYMDDQFLEQGFVSLSKSLQKNKHLRELHLYSHSGRIFTREKAWKQFVLRLQNCHLTKIVINLNHLFSTIQEEAWAETVNQDREWMGLPLLSIELHPYDKWLLQ